MKRIIILTILSACIFGCATPPRDAARFSETKIGKPTADNAVVVLFRRGSVPAGCYAKAIVNSKEIASLPLYSFSWLYVEPGEVNLDTKYAGLCLTFTSDKTYKVEPGKTYYFEHEQSRFTDRTNSKNLFGHYLKDSYSYIPASKF